MTVHGFRIFDAGEAMKKLFLILILMLVWPLAAWGVTYYVSNASPVGSDSNNGTSPSTPWLTIAKVNASKFQPGDSVLFNRGCTWREQLTVSSSGTSGNPITFGAYGSGVLPTITGADLLNSAWTQTSGTVWQTKVTTKPKMVIFNGIMGIGVSGVSSIVSANEWYWAPNVLCVYSTSNPATAFTNPGVEAAQRDFGFLCKKGYVTLQDVHVTHVNGGSGGGAIYFSNMWTDSTVIASPQAIGVVSDYNYNAGIEAGALGTAVTNVLVQNCTCSHNGDAGILIGNWDSPITGVTIQGNVVSNNMRRSTSLMSITHGGIYLDSVGNGTSYDHTLTNAVVQGNTVTGTVYEPGIWIDTVGSNVIVQDNTTENNLDGIMVEDSDGVQVSYNQSYNNTRLGIQLTRLVHNNTVYNNTVYGCATGIATGWTNPPAGGVTGNLVKNNISWGNSSTAFSAQNGGENDGTNGSGNVYSYNDFGPTASNFLQWGSSTFYSTLSAWQTASSQSNNLASDPLFVSTSTPDFHLDAGSPAIEAGVNVGLTTDYAGNLVGTPPTIGAYEYYSLSAPTGLRLKTP